MLNLCCVISTVIVLYTGYILIRLAMITLRHHMAAGNGHPSHDVILESAVFETRDFNLQGYKP